MADSQRSYDDLLERLGVGVVVLDRHGNPEAANRCAYELLELPHDFLNRPAGAVDVVDERGLPMSLDEAPSWRTLRTGTPVVNQELGVQLPSGTRWLLVTTEPMLGADGTVTGVVCTFVDVSERRHAQEALGASEQRFRLLAENAVDVIYRISLGPPPFVEYVNPAIEDVLGCAPADVYAEPRALLDALHPDDREVAKRILTDGPDGVETVLLRFVHPDGPMIWTEHRVVPLRDANGRTIAVEGIGRDVTALKIKEAYLSHSALHDPLTGLPNRVLFLDRLDRAIARTQRNPSLLAVLYVDLDRFKTVNDSHGHEAGDRLLVVIARRLQGTLRPSDSVARLGGDEFAAILPDLAHHEEAMAIAARLLDAIAQPVDLGGAEITITGSVGEAECGDATVTAAEVLRRADSAMYAAKDRGRARVECFDEIAPGGPTPAAA